MAWIRSFVEQLGRSACRILTLLGKGADDLYDCRADDEASDAVTVEKRAANEVAAD